MTGDEYIPITGTDGASPVEIGPPMFGPSKVRVEPAEDGVITCTVVGDGELAADDQIEPWRQAAAAATAALGSRNRDFEWTAIIDTDNDVLHGLFRIGALTASRTLGPVRLTPGGVCLRAHVVRADQLYSESGGFRYTIPVVTAGHVSSYKWEDQAELGTRVGGQHAAQRRCDALKPSRKERHPVTDREHEREREGHQLYNEDARVMPHLNCEPRPPWNPSIPSSPTLKHHGIQGRVTKDQQACTAEQQILHNLIMPVLRAERRYQPIKRTGLILAAQYRAIEQDGARHRHPSQQVKEALAPAA